MTMPDWNDPASIHDWLIHREIENLAGRSTFPMVDCEREFTYEVIQDFGLIEVQHEPTDECRALPVRLTLGPDGLQIELGDYDLGDRQIDVLRRAVETYIRLHAKPSGASG